ncbi:zinc finger protein 85-like [Ptychodera flava]|uniref:zinc finger protein 85-like n=1 Tax=Ptychodera flava TaxID=63121 RepID=UPI00396A4D35
MTTRPMELDYSVEDLSSSILTRLNEFRKQSLYTDIEFCAEEQSFACHQAILASCSPMFTSVLTSDAHKDKIRECFAAMDANSVKDVLDFMYTGKVTIAVHNVEQLLKVSTELKFEELASGCNITVGSDDADVFDSDSDGNDDPYEEDTANEEIVMSSVHTEADIREDECKIENGDQNEAGVPELLTESNPMVAHRNQNCTNMGEEEQPVSPAGLNQPYLFETDSSVAGMNIPGSHIKDDPSLSGQTQTDIGNNIHHAGVVAHKTKFQTDHNKHIREENPMDINGREALFKCEFCGENFPRNHLLQKHSNQEHGDKIQGHSSSDCDEKHKYLCTECNCGFGSKGLLQDHLSLHCQGLQQTKQHGTTSADESQEISTEQSANTQREKDLHECAVCNEDFKLQTHQCEICKKSFTTNRLLTQHRDKIHVERVWSCQECGVKFNQYKSLKEHRKIHDQDLKYQCKRCKKWFGRKDSFKGHMKRHRLEKSIECKICNKVFKMKGNYVQHMNMHDRKTAIQVDLSKHKKTSRTTEKICKCPECAESFNGTLSLRLHITKMHAVLEHCKLCNEVFPTKDELYQHRQRVHKLRNYPCADCKVAFDNKHNLFMHKRNMHSQESLICKECGSMFENRELLKQHRIHNKEALYKCDVCDKTFGRKESFDMHVRGHKYEKPYPCEECGKVFKRKEHLEKHFHTHSSIKLYSCPVCHKYFKYKSVC